ncbi:condensation domain-containing protein [Amycolatopsis magusensis]|uniref:condensation domain-containing protein n=1 Tax=Amycolatopsis magusensis TaxID=882444 RepID=UPI003C2E1657
MTEPNLLSTDPAQAQVIEQEVEAALLRQEGVADGAVVFAGVGESARRNCVRCGITGKYPGLTFDEAGVCSLCVLYEENREQIDAYWGDISELAPKLRAKAEAAGSEYDCLLLFSGGKDSTYVLYRLVDLGLRVMTFTFDNGFISTTALRNVEEVTGELGIEHVTKTRADQNKIFLLSLQEHKSVCNGCFRSLLDLSTELAHHRGIPSIVTGLSRGQIMDERLSWFHQQGIFDRDEIEEKLALGRRVYHQSSGTGAEAAAVDAVEVVDFYRYSEVTKDEIRALLKSRSKIWAHPEDTGFCSSNCLINDVGVYVHAAERGFHNYEAPTRWEVRLGHLAVAEADEELQGPVNSTRVKRMLAKIGYPDPAEHKHLGPRMTAYYVPRNGVAEEVIRASVAAVLPDGLVPERWVAVDEIPRRAGVVDRSALKAPVSTRFGRGKEDSSHPLTPSQKRVTERTPLAEQARALLVTLPGAVDTAKVKKIVLQLLMQHDALRMRFTQDEHGWRQQPVGAGGTLPVVRLDLSTVTAEQEPALLKRAVAKLRARLDPAEGRVLQVTALERGPRPAGLLLVLHELAADTASWRLILEDVVTACRQIGAGEPVELARSEPFPGTAPVLDDAAADPGPALAVLTALGEVLPAALGRESVTIDVADHTAPHRRTGRIVGRLSDVDTWRVGPGVLEPTAEPAEVRYDHFGDVRTLLPAGSPVTVSDVPEVDFTELPGTGPHGISIAGAVRDGRLRLTWRGAPEGVAQRVADRLD